MFCIFVELYLTSFLVDINQMKLLKEKGNFSDGQRISILTEYIDLGQRSPAQDGEHVGPIG